MVIYLSCVASGECPHLVMVLAENIESVHGFHEIALQIAKTRIK